MKAYTKTTPKSCENSKKILAADCRSSPPKMEANTTNTSISPGQRQGAGGVGNKAETKRTSCLQRRNSAAALLLIDLQNDFIEGSLAIKSAHDVIPVVNRLRTHEYWQLVLWTLDSHPADHCSFISNVDKHPFHEKSPIKAEQAKVFDTVILKGPEKLPEMEQTLWPVHCVEGTWGWKLHKGLKLESADEFVKKGTNTHIDSYSAFYDNAKLHKTNLHNILQREGIKDIYLCGLAWDYCVAFTALEGRELGYNVHVITDGCKGVSTEGVTATTLRMKQAGVKFISSQDFEKALEEERSHSYQHSDLKGPKVVPLSVLEESREPMFGHASSNC